MYVYLYVAVLPMLLLKYYCQGIVGLRSGSVGSAREDCTRARAEAVDRSDAETTLEADECLKQLLAFAA